MSGPAEVHEAAASTGDKEFQVPEWETAAVKVKSANTVLGSRGSLRNRFDAALPPYRRYLGLRRKTFLWLLLGVVIALLTLVIGLATGLSQHSRCVCALAFTRSPQLTRCTQTRPTTPLQRQTLHRRPHILRTRPGCLRRNGQFERLHRRRLPHPLRCRWTFVKHRRQQQ